MADISQIRLPSGDTFDLIDEKSGYITAQYIENKTDYSIPVSRVGEIVVGETAIGTDSTNFPTSKAVVDYVDERVVQEIGAIDVGVTSVNGQTGSVTLSASDVGALSSSTVIPSKTSDLTNDSGYLTASDIASVMTYKGTKANYAALPSTGNTTGDVWHLTDTGAEWAWDGSAWQELGTAIDLSNYLTTSDIAAWAKASTKPTYTAAEVGALPDSTAIPSKTSDLQNDSGFITGYTETDPVFSASAAAGITSTDISNWNNKSDTDEKLKISNISITSAQTYYPIFGDNGVSVATRQYDATGLRYQVSTNYSELILGCYNPKKQGKITLFNSGYYKTLLPSTLTSSGTILLPDANGTIALTSDIPQVYSSTNTGGYLTMATLPIYDGTVE